ncbi:MAG: alpha/beta hydrolase [Acetobacteraceae bacterium]
MTKPHVAEAERLDRGDGVPLACVRTPGREPTVVFLPGFKSDMTGEKALATEALCAARGTACLRLDYSGHGSSGGRFEDGSVGRWTEDALVLIDRLSAGPLVLVGSSMGGWIALLVALARPGRVAALVGIAAAPDFTETLMWDAMTPAERATLLRDGTLHVPSQYGDPYPVTRHLIEDGRTRLLLHEPIPIRCPVRLLHGQRDPDVPWSTALRLADRLEAEDVQLTLIKDGDHRLSRPQDLALLRHVVETLPA